MTMYIQVRPLARVGSGGRLHLPEDLVDLALGGSGPAAALLEQKASLSARPPAGPLAFLGRQPILGCGPIVRGPDHKHIAALADLRAHPVWPILRPSRLLMARDRRGRKKSTPGPSRAQA
jgi:hypothetical protein